MITKKSFLVRNQDGTEDVRVGENRLVGTPSYIPEIKGDEDFASLILHQGALPADTPIMVPAKRWPHIRTVQNLPGGPGAVRDLLRQHPSMYYLAPELFRYTMPLDLVTTALGGVRSQTIKFNKHFRKEEYAEAFGMLHEFYRPFVEAQIDALVKNIAGAKKGRGLSKLIQYPDRSVAEAWSDPRADGGYDDIMADIVQDAAQFPDSTVVSLVPPILSSSEPREFKRMLGANLITSRLCEAASKETFGSDVYPAFHIYADAGILRGEATEQTLNTLREGIEKRPFSAVVVTMTGYESIWEHHLQDRLFAFATDVVNIAGEQELPVIFPRSGWYGGYLTDAGVHAWGSLLNGNERYTPRRREGGPDEENQFGKIPIIDLAIEVSIEEFESFLENHDELPEVPGLPSRPPQYQPGGNGAVEVFGRPKDFRMNFGKARRLGHAAEANRFLIAKKQGIPRPAKEYFSKSEHKHLRG